MILYFMDKIVKEEKTVLVKKISYNKSLSTYS